MFEPITIARLHPPRRPMGRRTSMTRYASSRVRWSAPPPRTSRRYHGPFRPDEGPSGDGRRPRSDAKAISRPLGFPCSCRSRLSD